MPLPEGLLNPIPGENPSGQNLRYDPVYDKIREARRTEDELQLSEEAAKSDIWATSVKKADFVQVIKLATEVLSKRSKDLQIAVWLTEALLAQERVPGLTQGLNLVRGLMENFWDTLYPEIEDGDLEMRLGPLEWVGSLLDAQVRKVPLTKNKLDWFKFQESRRVGYERDTEGNEAKTAARQTAIADKKCTGEEFDAAVKMTGDAFYQQMTADLAAAMEATQTLETLCDEKFGRSAPNFANLKKAIEDLQDVVREYWRPQEQAMAEAVEELAEDATSEATTDAGAAPVRKRATAAQEPLDSNDAMRRVVDLAAYLRTANPASPVPYLLLRGLRWGELRSEGSSLPTLLLEPPATAVRQSLKNLANEGNWEELLGKVEAAMGQPCGRGWLDLQRYAVRACENLGHEPAAAAIRGELRALLSDYPDLLSASLTDDTPAANNETQTWIKESILPSSAAAPEPETRSASMSGGATQASPESNGSSAPDVLEVARQAALSGRIQEAVELLSREIAQERSGRARFLRKAQLAEVCLSAKYEAVAYPILEELAEEIDRRKLEEWEESSALAQTLALLLRCMDKLGRDDAAKQRIYQKICRLDPVQVLSGMR